MTFKIDLSNATISYENLIFNDLYSFFVFCNKENKYPEHQILTQLFLDKMLLQAFPEIDHKKILTKDYFQLWLKIFNLDKKYDVKNVRLIQDFSERYPYNNVLCEAGSDEYDDDFCYIQVLGSDVNEGIKKLTSYISFKKDLEIVD